MTSVLDTDTDSDISLDSEGDLGAVMDNIINQTIKGIHIYNDAKSIVEEYEEIKNEMDELDYSSLSIPDFAYMAVVLTRIDEFKTLPSTDSD